MTEVKAHLQNIPSLSIGEQMDHNIAVDYSNHTLAQYDLFENLHDY